MTEPTSWESTWEFVQPGTQLLISGYAWVCVWRSGSRYNMLCPALSMEKPGQPTFNKPVTVIGPGHPKYMPEPGDKAHALVTSTLEADDLLHLAETMLVMRLGGIPIVQREMSTGVNNVPTVALSSPQLIRTHLLVLHDVFGEETEDGELAAMHRDMHDLTPSIPHVHEGTR